MTEMFLSGLGVVMVLGAASVPATPPAIPPPAPHQIDVPASQMPRSGQDTLSYRVPVYPRATTPVVRVGDTLEAHGLPMNIQSFYTDDPPPRVLGWYKAFFAEWHLPMLGDGDLSIRFAYPSIGVFDELNGVDIHVICMPGDVNGKTMVLLALSDILTYELNEGKAVQTQHWGGLPEYAGAVDPSAVASSDGEVRTVSVTFSTNDSPERVMRYYAHAFENLGYTQQTSQKVGDPSLASLDFAQRRSIWHLAATESDPTDGSKSHHTTVFATWTSRPEVTP